MNSESKDNEAYEEIRVLPVERYMPAIATVLKHIRMWPVTTFSPCKMAFLTGCVIILVLLITIDAISGIALLIIDMSEFSNTISILVVNMTSIIKWCYLTIRNRGLYEIVAKLERCHVFCQRIDSTKEGCEIYESKMERARQYCDLFLYVWMSGPIASTIQWCATPLIFGAHHVYFINDTVIDRVLPYSGWIPLDANNVVVYVSFYIIQTMGLLGACVGIVCYDTFYISLLIIICMQLRYANITLSKIDLAEDKRAPEVIFMFKEKLKNCVNYHVEIIDVLVQILKYNLLRVATSLRETYDSRFVEMLQTFTSPIMFVQCFETMFDICFLSFETAAVKIMMKPENLIALSKLTVFFACTVFQFFWFCYTVSQLGHLASQISHSAYACGWQIMIFKQRELSTKQQFRNSNLRDICQLVQMIIMQAQRPIVLTGGPFYVFSMETFRAIMSLGLSNCIMLRQLSSEDE